MASDLEDLFKEWLEENGDSLCENINIESLMEGYVEKYVDENLDSDEVERSFHSQIEDVVKDWTDKHKNLPDEIERLKKDFKHLGERYVNDLEAEAKQLHAIWQRHNGFVEGYRERMVQLNAQLEAIHTEQKGGDENYKQLYREFNEYKKENSQRIDGLLKVSVQLNKEHAYLLDEIELLTKQLNALPKRRRWWYWS